MLLIACTACTKDFSKSAYGNNTIYTTNGRYNTNGSLYDEDGSVYESVADSHATQRYVHSVKSGDTLANIAEHYGIGDYKKLAKWNGICPPYIILPGQKIKLTPSSNSKSCDSGNKKNTPSHHSSSRTKKAKPSTNSLCSNLRVKESSGTPLTSAEREASKDCK